MAAVLTLFIRDANAFFEKFMVTTSGNVISVKLGSSKVSGLKYRAILHQLISYVAFHFL